MARTIKWIKKVDTFFKQQFVSRTINYLIITACLGYLFYDQLIEKGMHNAVLFVLLLVSFLLAFLVPALLIAKLEKKTFDAGKYKKALMLYLFVLVMITLITEEWVIAFMFPCMSILWFITTWIGIMLKKFLTRKTRD